MEPKSASGAGPHPIQGRAAVQRQLASCNLCRQRKIKCDRADPCSNCIRSSATCVSSPPSRLPRGRQGGRRKVDTELMHRVAKLENLVKDLEGELAAPTRSDSITSDKNEHAPRTHSNKSVAKLQQHESPGSDAASSESSFNRYIGSSFWVSLTDEINGLKEVLDPSSEDEEEDRTQILGKQSSNSGSPWNSSFVFSQSHILMNSSNPLEHPSPSQVQVLLAVYLSGVDPVFKLLHPPALRRYFNGETEDLACSPGPKGLEALKFAIYYAATASLTELECVNRLNAEKVNLLAKFRYATELALAKADFVNTVDISTLQALVIFLAAIRTNDNTRLPWTLISLAVRIAHAIGLHRENSFASLRPFQREMRRRIWWQLCVLDIQHSEDRGSDPVITEPTYNTKRPLHINDTDLSPEGVEELQEREGFTDMTFAAICHEVIETCNKLNWVPAREPTDRKSEGSYTWSERKDLVFTCHRRLHEKYVRHCDLSTSLGWASRMVADVIIASLWLTTCRPLQGSIEHDSSSDDANPNILLISVEVLEKSTQILVNPVMAPYRWLCTTYVQWHALAVTLAELCVQTEGPVVERAWSLVEDEFKRAEKHVADSTEGMLWRPVKKLMNRARAVRNSRNEAASTSDFLASMGFDDIAPSNETTWMNTEATISGLVEFDHGMPDAAVQTLEQPTQQDSMRMIPFDWDPWLVANPSSQTQYSDEINQMAWANWENFISDFHAEEEMSI